MNDSGRCQDGTDKRQRRRWGGGLRDKEGSGMEKDRNKDDVGTEEEWKEGKTALQGGGGVSELRCRVKVGRRAVFTLA